MSGRQRIILFLLIVNAGLAASVLYNQIRLWRIQAEIQAMQAKTTAHLPKSMQPCHDGMKLEPGESCYVVVPKSALKPLLDRGLLI